MDKTYEDVMVVGTDGTAFATTASIINGIPVLDRDIAENLDPEVHYQVQRAKQVQEPEHLIDLGTSRMEFVNRHSQIEQFQRTCRVLISHKATRDETLRAIIQVMKGFGIIQEN